MSPEVIDKETNTTATPPKPATTETTAGNYFVSNYPPFSFWKPEYIDQIQSALDRPPAPNTPLGLYVHIPFCRKRCHFCYFKVYTDKNAAAIRGYLNGVHKEMDTYMDRAFIGGRKPNFVYFGGGTPSYLSVNQLKELTNGLKDRLPWDEVEEVTFECEPGTLSEGKLKAIRDIGVTRLSLGIENFDDHILEINGRAHRSGEVENAYRYARQVGFPQINIDLIAGMVEETEDNWKRNIEKTLELQPESVTIYQMEVPYNTTIFKEMKAQGKLTAPVANWETKRRWVSEAFDAFLKEGYSISSAYTAVRDPSKTKFIYRDRLWEGADLLSLGVASFGHIGGVHYQNKQDFEPYMEDINAGNPPLYRAYTPNAEERLIREFVLQLKTGSVTFDYFNKKFDTDVSERFAQPMAIIEDWGYGKKTDSGFSVNREGLLEVDRLLHEFFLPEHRTDRIV